MRSEDRALLGAENGLNSQKEEVAIKSESAQWI
jgi:hypothetical protein